MRPLVVLNTVGLTSRMLAHAPRLRKIAEAGWTRPLGEAYPAVTCASQATMLTGKLPSEHGIVGNGWLFRDTMEVRFWQQSNRLLQAEPVYATAVRRAEERGQPFRCAKVFWWFNQGAKVALSLTPKPHYGADGNKAFDVQSYPDEVARSLTRKLGPFPFPTFWGPMAGLASTAWIANAAAEIVRTPDQVPNLTLVYLPHLDYEPQRLGPARCDWAKLVGELDRSLEPLLDAAQQAGARVWIVNEYTHVDVDTPIYLNRALREAGLLVARPGPFGEQLELFASKAFAVCDHQIAHVHAEDAHSLSRAREVLAKLPGVDRIFVGPERSAIGMDHPRAGEMVVVSKPSAWFAYPFWLDDRQAPDYARCVDIHRKPGYDPCELFFDPKLIWPKGRAIRRLIQKKLGFRTLFDVVPLDASLVRGSHGLPIANVLDKPVLIADGPAPTSDVVPQTAVRDLMLQALELEN